MSFNINVHEKLVINGKEYGSIEEVPAEFREAVVKAMSRKGVTDAEKIEQTLRTKITVNGVEYENEQAMPAEVRKLYRRTMDIVSAETAPSVSYGVSAAAKSTSRSDYVAVNPVRRGSDGPTSSAKTLIVLAALAGVAALAYLLTRGIL